MASVNRVKYGRHFVTCVNDSGEEVMHFFESATAAKKYAKTIPGGHADQELGEGPPRWEVTYRTPDGRGRSKRFAKKGDADRFAARVEVDKDRGAYVDTKAGRITLKEYAEVWMKGRRLSGTSREQMESRFKNHVYPEIGDLPLNRITPETLAQWLIGLHHLAESTRSVIWINVSSVFASAVDNGRLAKNPCSAGSLKSSKPKPTREKIIPWTVDQVADVHEQLPERYKPLAFLGAGLGLRQGELFGLAVEDVDFLRSIVTVRRQVLIIDSKLFFGPPKYGKEREVPLPASVRNELAAYLAQFPAREVSLAWRDDAGRGKTKRKPGSDVIVALIVTSREGKALNRNYINDYVWKVAVSKAGMSTVREHGNGSHALRHHYASVLLDAGESIVALSEYLGHHDPGFTLRTYTHLMDTSGDRTKKAVDEAFDKGIRKATERPVKDDESAT
jgi:integrase